MIAVTGLLVGFTAGVILATTQLGRLWRHQSAFLDRPQSWWPYGRESWPRFVRLIPLAIAFCWLMIIALVLGTLLPAADEDAFGFVRPLWFSLPVAASPFVFFALAVCLYRYAWPSFLVPPHLRDSKGKHRSSTRSN